MNPSSRRNSLTSVSTSNSSYTLTNSSTNLNSARDLSTDNLLNMDEKFQKKSIKPSSNPLSPNLNSIPSFQNHQPHHQPHHQPQLYQQQQQQEQHQPQQKPHPRRSMSSPALYQTANGFRKTDAGTYYFPNGEIFRPRMAPAKRNRPSKLNKPNSRSNSLTNYAYDKQNDRSNSLPQQPIMSSPAPIPAPPPTANSQPNIPRNHSFNNLKSKSKNDLVHSIRSNKLDTPTNLNLSTNIENHQRTKSISSQNSQFSQHSPIINQHYYQTSPTNKFIHNSNNLIKDDINDQTIYLNPSTTAGTASHSAANLSNRNKSNTTLTDSNPSSLSNFNLNRSSSNTPQTSINDQDDSSTSNLLESIKEIKNALKTVDSNKHNTIEQELKDQKLKQNNADEDIDPIEKRNYNQDLVKEQIIDNEKNVISENKDENHISQEKITKPYQDNENKNESFEENSQVSKRIDDALEQNENHNMKHDEIKNDQDSSIPNKSINESNENNANSNEQSDDDEEYHSPFDGDNDQTIDKLKSSLNNPGNDKNQYEKDQSEKVQSEKDQDDKDQAGKDQDDKDEAGKDGDDSDSDKDHKDHKDHKDDKSDDETTMVNDQSEKEIPITPNPNETTLNTLNEVSEESNEQQFFTPNNSEIQSQTFPQLSDIPKINYENSYENHSNLNSPTLDMFCTPSQGSPEYPEPTILDDSVERLGAYDKNDKIEDQPELIKEVRNSLIMNDNDDQIDSGKVKKHIITIPRSNGQINTGSNPSTPQSVFFDFQNNDQFNKFLNDDQYVPPRGDVAVVGGKIRKHERSASSISSFNSIVNGEGASDRNSSTYVLLSPRQQSPLSPTFNNPENSPNKSSRLVREIKNDDQPDDNNDDGNSNKKPKLDKSLPSPQKIVSMLDPPSIPKDDNITKINSNPDKELPLPPTPTLNDSSSFNSSTFKSLPPSTPHNKASPLPPLPSAVASPLPALPSDSHSSSPKKNSSGFNRAKSLPGLNTSIKKSASAGNFKTMFKKIFMGKPAEEEEGEEITSPQKNLDPPLSTTPSTPKSPASPTKQSISDDLFKKSDVTQNSQAPSSAPSSPSKKSIRSARKSSLASNRTNNSVHSTPNHNKFSPKLFLSPFTPPTSSFKTFHTNAGENNNNNNTSHTEHNSPVNFKKLGALKKNFSFANLKQFGSSTNLSKQDTNDHNEIDNNKNLPEEPKTPLPILEGEEIDTSEDLTLTKLPTIETDNHLFDDVLIDFDEKLNTVDEIPNESVKKNKLTTFINEPFLKDDELTRDQIEDQQKKDLVDGSQESLPRSDEAAGRNVEIHHSRHNSDEYVDDNIRYLQQELVWPIDNENDLRSSEELSIITKSNESVLNFDETETGEETILVDNEQLVELFNNLNDYQRRRLPMHLKHIRQFQDFKVLEISIKKFENTLNFRPPLKDDSETHKLLESILKKQLTQTGKNNKKVLFSNKISISETFPPEMYKRYNKSVTQYTLTESFQINKIKNEMNQYKCNEMLVHEKSQNNTHFYY